MSMSQTWRTRSLSLVLVSALMMISCTSFKRVELDDIQATLKAGDTVQIVAKDGREFELKILTITTEAIVGTPVSNVSTAEASEVKDQRVEFAEIGWLGKREISPSKPLVLILAGLVFLPIAAIGILLSAARLE